MLSKLFLISLASAFALGAAIPDESYESENATLIETRQSTDPGDYWCVDFYTSGCDEDPATSFCGHDPQVFYCTGGHSEGYHNVKMTNVANNGRKVQLFADLECANQIGEVTADETCFAVRQDSVVAGYGVVPV